MANELSEHDRAPSPPVEVPSSALSAETLEALIESFILRDGTDYGAVEVSLAAKMAQIKKQIDHGDVKIVFDPDTESVTLLTARDFKRMQTVQHKKTGSY